MAEQDEEARMALLNSDGSGLGSKRKLNKEAAAIVAVQASSRAAASRAASGGGAVFACPSSLIVNFFNSSGESAGPPVEIPSNVTNDQLEQLVNSLLDNEGKVPYAFYINDMELTESLTESLKHLHESGKGVSFEENITISYQPLSVFKVRPVTRCIETMVGHTDAVIQLAYSPDGKRLASGGGDMAVRFWNVITNTPSHTCTGHRNHVLCTTWAPDSSVFVSADKSGEIRVWDPKTGTQIGQALTGHKKWITALVFEPLHLDPSCRRIATSSNDQTIKIWNLRTGLCEDTISGHTASIECLRWGGKGLLYSGSRDRTIKVWDPDGHGKSRHKLVRTLTGHGHRINFLALNCDYVLRTGAYILGKPIPTGEEEVRAQALQRYNEVVGSEGEKLVSGSDDFTMFMWLPETSKTPLERMLGHQQLINHLAFSPDGRYLASGSFDKKVKIWCGRTGRFITTLTGHVGAIYQVAWSADSEHIVSASKDSTVKVWSIKDPKKALYTLPGHADEVYGLDWSPDGTQVASGSKDRTVKIWHN